MDTDWQQIDAGFPLKSRHIALAHHLHYGSQNPQ